MENRLQKYQSALDSKTDIITDVKFLKRTGDTSKPSPNKIILDDSGNGQGVVPYLPLNELKNKVNNWWILSQEIL